MPLLAALFTILAPSETQSKPPQTDNAPSLLLPRAIALLEKAQHATKQAAAELPGLWSGSSCGATELCKLVRDAAIYLDRPDLIESAEATHARPCPRLLEAKVALAAKTGSRVLLDEALHQLNAKTARLYGEDLVTRALQGGSVEMALAVLKRIEQLDQRNPDAPRVQGSALQRAVRMLWLAPAAGTDPRWYEYALRLLDSCDDLPPIDQLGLPKANALVRTILSEGAATSALLRAADTPSDDIWDRRGFASLYDDIYGGWGQVSLQVPAILRRDAAKLEKAQAFLHAIAEAARQGQCPQVRICVLSAAAGAFLRIGCCAEAEQLARECFAEIDKVSLCESAVERLLQLVHDLEAAARDRLVQPATITVLAARAASCRERSVRQAVLAALACAQMNFESTADARRTIDELLRDLPAGAQPKYLTRELVRLSYRIAQQCDVDVDESVRLALGLARGIPAADGDSRALHIVGLVECLAGCGHPEEAEPFVPQLVPLFTIPVGEYALPDDWLGPAMDFGRACFTSCCNHIALAYVRREEPQRALQWLARGAQYAYVRNEELAIHDEREAVMRAALAAWRATRDPQYLRAGAVRARAFWQRQPRIAAGWIAILAFALRESGDVDGALSFLKHELHDDTFQNVDSYGKLLVLVTFAEAFCELGADSACDELIGQCLTLAAEYQARQEALEREQIIVEGEPATCYPPIARALLWRGERMRQTRWVDEACTLMLRDERKDAYCDSGPFGVRLAEVAIQQGRPDLFERALELAEQGQRVTLLGFGLPHRPLDRVMLLTGRSGDIGLIQTCELRAEAYPDLYTKVRLLTQLAGGIFQRVGVPYQGEDAPSLVDHSRALLELWNVRWVNGAVQFDVPPEARD